MQKSLFFFNLFYNSFAKSLVISTGNQAIFDSLIIFDYNPWLTIATASLGSTAGQTLNLYIAIALTKKRLVKTYRPRGIALMLITSIVKRLMLLSCAFLGQFGGVMVFVMPCLVKMRLINSIMYILLSNMAFYIHKFYKLKLALQFLS